MPTEATAILPDERRHADHRIPVLIWGSCVARDMARFLDPSKFSLVNYTARQSLMSAGTNASFLTKYIAPLESAFQQKNLLGDLKGDGFTRLGQAPSDSIIILDLIDERNGVMDFSGRMATPLKEFSLAQGHRAARRFQAKHILFGSDEHFDKWSLAAERLKSALVEGDHWERTIVLESEWASSYDDGTPLEHADPFLSTPYANAAYRRYFTHLTALGFRTLPLPPEQTVTVHDHRWQPIPYHYSDSASVWWAHEIDQMFTERA